MENILFINVCVRDNSRTLVIANEVLRKYDGCITEKVINDEKLSPLTKDSLIKRDELIKNNCLNHEMFSNAHEFAMADIIVIAAPFWDLGFPALLKIYLESVMVAGITFNYENGVPQGMCRAKSLEYITTSGGPIFEDYGYSYIKSLAKNFFGIEDVSCVMAQNMDVNCIKAEEVLTKGEIIEKR